MKLLLPNLVFVLIFLLGLVATGAMTRRMLERNAQRRRCSRHACCSKALAVRSYTSTQVAPLLETQMKLRLPAAVGAAFSATEVLARIQKNHPEYAYKSHAEPPTRATGRWSGGRRDRRIPPSRPTWSSSASATRRRPRALHRADPHRRRRLPALPQHGGDGAAHLVESTARPTASAGSSARWWGAQMVSVPTASAAGARPRRLGAVHGHARRRCSCSSRWRSTDAVVAGDPAGDPNFALADRVSLGELSAPGFASGAHDEIGRLATASFTRMRQAWCRR